MAAQVRRRTLSPIALRRFCRARELLRDTSPATPLTIAAVAREAAMSPYHFIRRFDALFGETPHQYRMRVRLEFARRLLARGEASVTDACLAAGFSSLGSFSALFTRRYGEGPAAFRRRWLAVPGMPAALDAHFAPGCLALMLAAFAAKPQFSRSAAMAPVQESGFSPRADKS